MNFYPYSNVAKTHDNDDDANKHNYDDDGSVDRLEYTFSRVYIL